MVKCKIITLIVPAFLHLALLGWDTNPRMCLCQVTRARYQSSGLCQLDYYHHPYLNQEQVGYHFATTIKEHLAAVTIWGTVHDIRNNDPNDEPTHPGSSTRYVYYSFLYFPNNNLSLRVSGRHRVSSSIEASSTGGRVNAAAGKMGTRGSAHILWWLAAAGKLARVKIASCTHVHDATPSCT